MRILLADADANILQALELSLLSNDFNVYTTDDGEEAVDLGKLYDYDILLLGDGLNCDVLKRLRAAKVKTPVLCLSASGDTEAKVKALSNGADDYMVRPVEPLELVARIHAVVRRSKGHAASVIEVGPMVVNLDTKTVAVSKQPVHLTGKEYAMLELMALRRGSLITKDMFLNHLYGGMDEPEIKIIDVFICKLRKKLALHGAAELVQTVWGRGYVLGQVEGLKEAGNVRDFADEPPVHVGKRTVHEAEALLAKKRFGEATLVPEAGAK